ncbi:MAG: putative bifunctional diguanylate cyclase/phosphodiesterase [Ilumatobacteraceae bacterium]
MERRLSSVLGEFARTLLTDFPIATILDHLVLRIVDVLPITSAGVTLIAPGANPHYIAASNDSALRFEQLQSELGEGPCLAAYHSGEAVTAPDLADDDRFPIFGPRAVAEGLMAVFTFPLRHGDERLGALDLYRATTGSLDAEEMRSAQTLADVATAYLLNARAREDLRVSSEAAREHSLHDDLTGLPNRALLIQRLEHAILRCQRSGKMVAILFADLDLFKGINDTFGHHVGDELLVAVAERLTGLLRPGDTVARLSGDEFVILCEDIDHASQVEHIATRIDDALARGFVLSGVEVRVSASVGIAFAGRGNHVPEKVLQEADMAMYHAKRNGRAGHAALDLGEHRLARHRASLARDLRGATARGELRNDYQPIVATADGRINAVEALVRWAHPVHGIVAPALVIPIAEQSGLIHEIGEWALERACVDWQRWRQRRPDDELGISVNVSAQQLMATHFVETVAAVLFSTRTEAKRLTIEVTESVLLRDGDAAVQRLNDLTRLGVTLAIDDFGTGYSSLSYLKRLPVDMLKIDRAFIADIDRDPASAVIVRAIVQLAHDLGIAVVAEGVESVGQYEQVALLGCDFCQGFFFAPPSSARQVEARLAAELGV